MQIYTSARISEPDPPRSTAAARTAPDLQSYTITQLKKVWVSQDRSINMRFNPQQCVRLHAGVCFWKLISHTHSYIATLIYCSEDKTQAFIDIDRKKTHSHSHIYIDTVYMSWSRRHLARRQNVWVSLPLPDSTNNPVKLPVCLPPAPCPVRELSFLSHVSIVHILYVWNIKESWKRTRVILLHSLKLA